MTESPFATRLVAWQQLHGRHGLPWQLTKDPYRVWLSEIMLQQTQVAAVMGYFGRFLDRFPNVQSLADATQDDVLALWSGLGYYSRARNLHRCASIVCRDHAGQFPTTAQLLETLPGIGPSTAAAIASICFNQRISIFDGNVQRVMARHEGYDGDLATSAARKVLLGLANSRLPRPHEAGLMPVYTQALMDLGATLCTPRSPNCSRCPVSGSCQALAKQQQAALPIKSRKLKRKTQLLWWLVVYSPDGRVWLVKRPPNGVWASLYGFPEFGSENAALSAMPRPNAGAVTSLPPFRHVLTHIDLVIHPLLVPLNEAANGTQPMQEAGHGAWLTAPETETIGLPKPVSQLLAQVLQS